MPYDGGIQSRESRPSREASFHTKELMEMGCKRKEGRKDRDGLERGIEVIRTNAESFGTGTAHFHSIGGRTEGHAK